MQPFGFIENNIKVACTFTLSFGMFSCIFKTKRIEKLQFTKRRMTAIPAEVSGDFEALKRDAALARCRSGVIGTIGG